MTKTPYPKVLLGAPCLALVYSIAVQVFLAGWHECSLTFYASSIALRLAVFIAAFGIFLATPDDAPIQSLVAPAIIFTIVSIVNIYRTRTFMVNGPAPSLDETAVGKVVFITGANTGIGKETARQLLVAGATVIMACRSESRAREAMKDILSKVSSKKNGSESSTAGENARLLSPRERLLFVKCDVSDYDSVRNAVKDFETMKLPLDILINNAGIMMGHRKENNKGHELNMACNHLGHFLLTNLLLPKLQQAEDGRIIIVGSCTYVIASDGFDIEDWNCKKRKYTMFSQYAQSKLANILMAKELTKRERMRVENDDTMKAVAVHIVHPGLVRTDVVRNMNWYLRYPNMLFSWVLVTLQKSPEAGAYTNVFCATSKSLLGKSGDYFSNSEVHPVNKWGNDKEQAKALWDLSVTLTS